MRRGARPAGAGGARAPWAPPWIRHCPGSQRTPRRTSQPVETGNNLTDITVEAQAREITFISETQQILVTSPPHSDASDSPVAHVIGEEDIETPISPLPSFSSSSEPTFSCGDMDSETFSCALNGIYDETVHWKRNLFKVPQAKLELPLCENSPRCSERMLIVQLLIVWQ